MKKTDFNKIHPFDFFLLLYGFLYGNLFAIQCSNIELSFLSIFGVVFLLEIIQKFIYSNFSFKKQKKFILLRKNWFFLSLDFLKFSSPVIFINTLKRGFLLGFFLEAFKVGS